MDWMRLIVKAEISDDLCAIRISGPNLRSAMHNSAWLIEINSLFYIGGNELVVLADFGNTIDLNSEKHWDALLFKFARQRDCRRSTPAVAKQNDSGRLLFFGRQ